MASDAAKDRAITLNNFFLACKECLAINNYHSLLAIMAAIKSIPITRMEETISVCIFPHKDLPFPSHTSFYTSFHISSFFPSKN